MIYDKPPRFGMSEANVRREVKSVLDVHGFFYWSNLQGLGCYKGIPDIIAIKGGRTLFIELKNYAGKTIDGRRVNAGKLSEHQMKFKLNVEGAGGFYVVATCGYDLEQMIIDAGLHNPLWK